MEEEPKLNGWQIRGARYYAHGLLLLLTFNVLVWLSEKPVPTDVWFYWNGIGVAMTTAGSFCCAKPAIAATGKQTQACRRTRKNRLKAHFTRNRPNDEPENGRSCHL